jgi:hypothetical protein
MSNLIQGRNTSLLTIDSTVLQVGLRDVTASLEEELALALPLFLQRPGNPNQLGTLHIVQHDDIGTSFNGFICLLF